jgi:hypothetical protein
VVITRLSSGGNPDIEDSGCFNPITTNNTSNDIIVRSLSITPDEMTASALEVCAGSDVDLEVVGGLLGYTATWEWYNDPGFDITRNVGTGAQITVNPLITTTYYVRAEGLCNTTDAVSLEVTVYTGAGNAFLVQDINRTGADVECEDGDWTYYATALAPDEFIFGIKKNSNTFTATVDIYDLPGATTYSSVGGVGPARGTFLIGRHWDVTLSSGSITSPVDVRFFVDPAEVLQAETEALDLLATTPLPNSYITPLTFFKTPDGVLFDPSTMVVDGNFTFTPPNVWIAPSSGLLNGVTYYQLDGITDFSGGSGGFSINDGGALLPVELASFRATSINDDFIRLDWTTLTEVNNDGFEIQRSANGIDFETIGWVNGNGNSTAKNDYSSNDFEAASGVNYYRLKQIDFDGQFEYSKIVSARMGADASISSLSVYPNPTKGDLFVEIEADNQSFGNIKIYNHMGQQVGNAKHHIVAGKNKLMVNTQNLISGTYLIMVESNEKIITTKFVVSK